MGEPEKNVRKRLYWSDDDDDDGTEFEVENGIDNVIEEDNVEDEEDVEDEDDDESYFTRPDRVSQSAPTFETPASLGEAAMEALLGPRAGPASEGGATPGPEGSQEEAEISLSQDLRFHSDADADFVITQTQKGKAKICYDGYRYSQIHNYSGIQMVFFNTKLSSQ